MRRLLAATLVVAAASAALVLAGPASAAKPAYRQPPVGHVWVIVLENKSYVESFSATSQSPYLGKVLTKKGALLEQYYATGHLSLDNYISMLSGQAPNVATQADCLQYTDFVGTGVVAADGQVVGQGCVYPASVKTLPDQLTAKGRTWRGYMEDMGLDPTREEATCGRPVVDATLRDKTQSATAKDQYAARHNPFVYFHSIVDSPQCKTNVLPLTALTGDLKSLSSTPEFSFITPDLCSDGHDGDGTGASPCVDGRPGGLTSADAFLQTWVPQILASPAFGRDGLLVITWDEAETAGTYADGQACCNEQTGPNTVRPAGPAGSASDTSGAGGGRVGAVLLSPYITPGTISKVPYNHYSALRTFEDLYGVAHLGYAGQAGLQPFGADVFTAAASPAVPPRPGQTTATGPASSDVPPAAVSPRTLPTTGGLPPLVLVVAAAAMLAGVAALRLRGPKRG